MKQSLQLKIGQQLTLTPQLQQAIKLLQLSTLDLQQTITETLASNPLLEEEESSSEETRPRGTAKQSTSALQSLRLMRVKNYLLTPLGKT